jgi:hypothetical protein
MLFFTEDFIARKILMNRFDYLPLNGDI